MTSTSQPMYDATWADTYTRLAEASIPGRSGLYRLCVATLAGLPKEATILVVGAGTGEELLALAKTLPDARFVAVEPAAAMADVCAARLTESGYSSRVELHRDLLSSLPPAAPFAAATSVLVSQHLTEPAAARGFFEEIRSRLLPGAPLFSADAHVPRGLDRNRLMDLWVTQIACTGIAREQAEQMRSRIEQGIAIRNEDEVVGLIKAAGFTDVQKLFSSLIYGAWSSRNP